MSVSMSCRYSTTTTIRYDCCCCGGTGLAHLNCSEQFFYNRIDLQPQRLEWCSIAYCPCPFPTDSMLYSVCCWSNSTASTCLASSQVMKISSAAAFCFVSSMLQAIHLHSDANCDRSLGGCSARCLSVRQIHHSICNKRLPNNILYSAYRLHRQGYIHCCSNSNQEFCL